MEQERDPAVQELVDRMEIEKCITRIARGMDRHDTELAKSGFHPGARDDHVVWIGPAGEVLEGMEAGHDQSLRGHQHYITNMTIDIDGDVAHVETYNIMGGTAVDSWEMVIGGGRYIDRLEKRDGVWGVTDRVSILHWWNPSQTMETLAPYNHPHSKDRNDISYARPLRVEREDRVLDHSMLTQDNA